MTKKLPSTHQIGERVKLAVIRTSPIYAFVRAVIFTASKVRYSLWIKEAETTLHNVDSAFVESDNCAPSETHDFGEDNYS